MSQSLQTLAMLAVPGVPIILTALLFAPRSRALGVALAPWAALPGLIVAIVGGPDQPVELGWLLVGMTLDVDALRRPFLLFSSLLWLAAGLYASAYHRDDARRARMFGFFLITLSGNLGLIVASDAVTFYLGFLTMSLAAYGLIVHSGSDEAMKAGRIYAILVVAGETLLLPGLWMTVSHARSLHLDDMATALVEAGGLPFWLLAIGFGVKAALVPLHVWLPLAHPVAPTPASAVLSGAMVKAGVLGWMTILPSGQIFRPDLAAAFIVLGMLGTFGAALAGVMQSRPKSVLAYSSVSQLGLITTTFGIALWSPEASTAALAAVTAYAFHHALAKGALFLGVGCVESAQNHRSRQLALALLAIPAVSLAGLPLTSGIVAKTALKEAVYGVSPFWQSALGLALPLAAVGTTLLMARFLWLMAQVRGHSDKPGLMPVWSVLVLVVVVCAFVPLAVSSTLISESHALSGFWTGIWPIALGIAVAWGMMRKPWRGPRIPEGDVLWPVMAAGRAVLARVPRRWYVAPRRARVRAARRAVGIVQLLSRRLARAEVNLANWSVGMFGFLTAVVGAFLLLG